MASGYTVDATQNKIKHRSVQDAEILNRKHMCILEPCIKAQAQPGSKDQLWKIESLDPNIISYKLVEQRKEGSLFTRI